LLRVKQEEEAGRLHLEQQEEANRLQRAQEAEAARLLTVQKEEEAARAKAEAARVKADEAKRIEAAAAAAAEAVSAASEESLLEMPVPAEVVAYREPASVDEAELAAVLEELERADAVTVESARSATIAGDIQTFEDPLDVAPLATNHEEDAAEDDKDIFSLPEKSGSSLPLPAIAGAIGLVIMLAGGGWFLMSGGPGTEKPVAAPPVQVAQPAAVEPSPLVEQVTAAPAETVGSTTETTEQPVPDTKTAPNPAKAKKAETKPQAEKKKAVTVDDLINDN
jgi:hypothetical protein